MGKPNEQQLASQVRVGVRVRPLTSIELRESGKNVLKARNPEVRIGERRFTYDTVFDAAIGQSELYGSVSPPLLKTFLEGYNATIMAYGQTGSGKTYTMGSEAHTELQLSDKTGLIPRFMNDLFASLQSNGQSIKYSLEASFLEVYGEDVHDLLDPARPSLPLREDANGGVVCAGLTHRSVSTASEALTVLHEGTLNRTTAATLMNLTSSRSHAVFSVTLTQTQCSQGVDVTTVSRFTFVDLAGSERMKKTGAEGERAREGIKINEGLLALGNVINALADEERLAEGKKVHVPYRQSKLTRLLQDALGGNSQTLFLACVSPSDTNASETLSTLHYANRARNIKNAPTKNVDSSTLEIQRLQSLVRVLESEAVKHKFGTFDEGSDVVGEMDEAILQRSDVVDYLTAVRRKSDQKHGLDSTMALGILHDPSNQVNRLPMSPSQLAIGNGPLEGTPNKSVIENINPLLLTEVNPDEEMAMMDQLLELQNREQEFTQSAKKGAEELKQVEGDIAEQERMLLQLKESLKVYHDMKGKYERLMQEVQNLEVEKAQLAEQLENASVDPTKGCSKKIKKELERVERNLVRARRETQKHREMYRKAEQEAKKCAVLERKISDLKAGRVRLVKKQKEEAARHREYTKAKDQEIQALKRKERKNEKRVSKMQTEILIHQKNREKREAYCKKMAEKVKQTESHLTKLLSLRQRELRKQPSSRARALQRTLAAAAGSESADSSVAPKSQETDSIEFVLDQAICDKVDMADTAARYEERVTEYAELMRKLMESIKSLKERKAQSNSNESETELAQAIEELELKIELVAQELETLKSELSQAEKTETVRDVEKLLQDKTAPVLRRIVIGEVEKLSSTQLRERQLTRELKLNQSVRAGLEDEVESLSEKVVALTKDLRHLRSLQSPEADQAEQIERLQSEKDGLIQSITRMKEEVSTRQQAEEILTKQKYELESDLSDKTERLAVYETADANGTRMEKATEESLRKVQDIWRELGKSSEQRHQICVDIKNCLDDTCARVLQEAVGLKETTVKEIEQLRSDIDDMKARLGISDGQGESSEQLPLLDQVELLRKIHGELEPAFRTATSRSGDIAKLTREIVTAIGLPDGDLPDDLGQLLDSGSQTLVLSDEFLDRCEKYLSALRLRKSEVLARNAELLKQTYNLVTDMNLGEEEIIPLVLQSRRRRSQADPSWWSKDYAETVARASSTAGGVVRVARSFHDHLFLVYESLASIANGRRTLSETLRSLVERAQKTLLASVEGEDDVRAASVGFHEALFRFPPLSKELIDACIAEVDALISGVDVMTHSESDALAVVWDALSVSVDDRGLFWSELNEARSTMESNPEGPFDAVVQTCRLDGEEWVLAAVKKATKGYRKLDARLFKLEKMHNEVEKLRSRQDAKSQIISLDSEVRILSSQLADFEDKKCSKQRLLTKKIGSSNLLKEERYRKQMQLKFTSKLEQLAKLLKVWRSNENSDFDPSLLSEEVRLLLKNADKMDTWVEKRTEFMHLRTVKSSKRPLPSSDNEAPSRPPRKRQARSAVGNRAVKESLTSDTATTGKAEITANRKKRPRAAPSPAKPSKIQKPAASSTPRRTRSRTRNANMGARAVEESKRRVKQPFSHVLDEDSTRDRDENVTN